MSIAITVELPESVAALPGKSSDLSRTALVSIALEPSQFVSDKRTDRV